MEEPLIYTSKGNIPIKDLEYKYWWIVNENEISFHEQYSLNGEIVKEGAHVYLPKASVTGSALVGGFDGGQSIINSGL